MDFLWDVYDSANESGDSVSLGFAPIHRVMREDMRASDALTTIYVMASGLAARSPASEGPIRTRLDLECMTGFGDFGDGERELADWRAIRPGDCELTSIDYVDDDAVPVYRPVVLGVPQTVVSTATFADPDFPDLRGYNRLGARRYFRIDLPSAGGLTVVAEGAAGTDPDFFLYRQGRNQCQAAGSACDGTDDSVADGREMATFTGLSAGTYVLEVYDCSNVGTSCRETPGPADRTITVTVTRP